MFRSPRSLITALVTVISAIVISAIVIAPATASAATVSVSVGTTDVVAPATQGYALSLSFSSTPDRYTIDIVKPDGSLSAPTITRSIVGSTSPVTAEGSIDLPADAPEGYWTVKVAYYAQGQTSWEARAQKVFRVSRPVAPGPLPDPIAPVIPEERIVPGQTVLPPQSDVITPRIALTKRANARTVKAGRGVTFTLRVSNVSKAIVRAVKVCDAVPARMTVVSLGKGRFENGRLCFAVGTLGVGASTSIKVRMRVDADAPKGTIVNRATATATGVKTVRASAKVAVKKVPRTRRSAPVTG